MQCSWTPPLIHHHPFQCRWTRLNFLVGTKALRKWFPKFVPWDTSGAHTQRWTRLWVRVCLNVVGLSACVNIQRYIVLHPVRLNLVPLNKPCRPRAPPSIPFGRLARRAAMAREARAKASRRRTPHSSWRNGSPNTSWWIPAESGCTALDTR